MSAGLSSAIRFHLVALLSNVEELNGRRDFLRQFTFIVQLISSIFGLFFHRKSVAPLHFRDPIELLAVAVAHKILKDHFKRRNILKLIDYFFMF